MNNIAGEVKLFVRKDNSDMPKNSDISKYYIY